MTGEQRPELAESYDFSDRASPRVGSHIIPWYTAPGGPLVEAVDEHSHILWLPVIIPSPLGIGRPEGTPVADIEKPPRAES